MICPSKRMVCLLFQRAFMVVGLASTACGGMVQTVDVRGMEIEKAGATPAPSPVDTSGDSSKGPLLYEKDIHPLFQTLGCAAAQCHDQTTKAGNLDLSAPAIAYAQIISADATKATSVSGTKRINFQAPASSLILTETMVPALEGAQHPAASGWKKGDTVYTAILTWIASGAGR